jgi:hypothetical protein
MDFMENGSPLACSLAPRIAFYFELLEASLNIIYILSILILHSQLCLGFKYYFPTLFLTKIYMNFLSVPCMLRATPSYTPLFADPNYEALH